MHDPVDPYATCDVTQNHLTYADMINQAGKRVTPTMDTSQAAVANADFSKVRDFYLILTDQLGVLTEPARPGWPQQRQRSEQPMPQPRSSGAPFAISTRSLRAFCIKWPSLVHFPN